MEYYTMTTNAGDQAIAHAIQTGTTTTFKQIVVGDGNGSYYEPAKTQTALRREVWRGDATVSLDDNNPKRVIVTATIPATVGGFTIREAGIFDTANTMMVVSKLPLSEKVAPESGASSDLVIRLYVEVSDASAVTITIDPSAVLATKGDVSEVENSLLQHESDTSNPHKVTAAQIGAPAKTTSDLAYYVNASTGNDENSGLASGTAFATISKAISMIPQIVNHTVTINVAAGTYSAIDIEGFVGKGTIVINGAPSGSSQSTTANYKVSIIQVQYCLAQVRIIGFTTTSIAGDFNGTIIILEVSTVYLDTIYSTVTDNVSGKLHRGFSFGSGNIVLYRCYIANKDIGLCAGGNSNISVNSTTFANCYFGYYTQGGGRVIDSGNNVYTSVTVVYHKDSGGCQVIDSNGDPVIESVALALLNGWTVGWGSVWAIKTGKVVTIYFNGSFSGPAGATLITLPAGWGSGAYFTNTETGVTVQGTALVAVGTAINSKSFTFVIN